MNAAFAMDWSKPPPKVVYLDDDFNIVPKAQARYARMYADDGSVSLVLIGEEPAVPRTFHTPGGHAHDQKSHGNWAGGMYVGDVSPGGKFAVTVPPMGPGAWKGQASQHPAKGRKGISYKLNKVEKYKIDTLLYRDDKGNLRGILYHYPQDIPGYEKAGNFNVLVDPKYQGRGIGSALVRQAGERWNVSLWGQDYTPEGAALARSLTHPDLTKPPKYDASGWLIPARVRKHSLDFHYPGGHAHDQSGHGNWAHGHPKFTSDEWPDGAAFNALDYHDKPLSVIKNPTQRELMRWAADDDIKLVRYAIDFEHANVAVWPAGDMYHISMTDQLGITKQVYGQKASGGDGRLIGVSFNNEDETKPSEFLDRVKSGALEGVRTGAITQAQVDALLAKLTRHDYALDFHRPGGQEHDQKRHGNWSPDMSDDITATSWRDGEVRKVLLTYWGRDTARTIEVIKNPTQREVTRWAGDEIKWLRFAIDYESGNVAVWDADKAIHTPVMGSIGIQDVGGAGISYNSDREIVPSNYLESVKDHAQFGISERVITQEDYDRVLAKLMRHDYTLDFHTPGGVEHDQSSHGNWAKGQAIVERGAHVGEPALASIRTEEGRIVTHMAHEEAVAVEPQTGAPVFSKIGEEHGVNFTPDELNALTGTLFTHNHPSGLSLSVDDLRFASHNNLAQMRATTRERTYVLERVGMEWPSMLELDSTYTREIVAHGLTGKLPDNETQHALIAAVAAHFPNQLRYYVEGKPVSSAFSRRQHA